MENPIKMDDLGVPSFLETPIYSMQITLPPFKFETLEEQTWLRTLALPATIFWTALGILPERGKNAICSGQLCYSACWQSFPSRAAKCCFSNECFSGRVQCSATQPCTLHISHDHTGSTDLPWLQKKRKTVQPPPPRHLNKLPCSCSCIHFQTLKTRLPPPNTS